MPHSWLPGFRVAVVLMEAVHHNPGEQWCVRHTMTAHSPCNVRVWLRRRHNRSEEHTSELQSPCNLVCRLLLEKNKGTPNKTQRSQIATDSSHSTGRLCTH